MFKKKRCFRTIDFKSIVINWELNHRGAICSGGFSCNRRGDTLNKASNFRINEITQTAIEYKRVINTC